MAIAQSAEALIGNTPLLKLNRLFPDMDIYAKLEYLNPAGSAQGPRGALDAQRPGNARPAQGGRRPWWSRPRAIRAWRWRRCARRAGYRLILTMPETMSAERRMLLSA